MTNTDARPAAGPASPRSAGRSLGRRAIKGGAIMGAAGSFEQAMRLARNMLLARILIPEDFGAMAIVLAVGTVFESITEVGIREAVIQSPRSGMRNFLNGAWWLGFVRSAVLYGLLFFGAPYVADFYDDPALVNLMRVAFLAFLFKGAMSIGSYVALKEMRFFKWAVIYQGGAVTGIVASILLALSFANVWALVIGFAVESGARTILSYIVCPYRPGIAMDRESVRKLLGFSSGMVGLPILTFVFMRSDVFFVGKLRPFADLGIYAMVTNLARMPLQFLSSILTLIMSSTFSALQEDKDAVNKGLLRATQIIISAGFPALVFAVFYGSELIGLVYGSAYAVAALPFALVFAAEMIRTLGVPIATIYIMSGKPQLHRRFTIIRAVTILGLLYPAVKFFGLAGAAAAGLTAVIVGHYFQVRRLVSFTNLQIFPYLAIHVRAVVASVIIVAFWFAGRAFLPTQGVVQLAAGIFGCAATYAVLAPPIVKWMRAQRSSKEKDSAAAAPEPVSPGQS